MSETDEAQCDALAVETGELAEGLVRLRAENAALAVAHARLKDAARALLHDDWVAPGDDEDAFARKMGLE